MIHIIQAAKADIVCQTFGSQTETLIVRALASGSSPSVYPSVRELNFEIRMRERTIASAVALNDSGASFATFAKTRGNPEYWTVEPNGALRLRSDRPPADAIRDIYRNGALYGFECATAIVIVFYKAALDVIGDAAYNRLFANTYLFHWNTDRDLGLTTVSTTQFIPGDALYFDNPDVDPRTPEWQGENAILLGNGLYYGHGIGIGSDEDIINALNAKRRPGASRSAFLLPQATRPNYVKLSQSAEIPGPGAYPGESGLPSGLPFRAIIGQRLYLAP